MLIGYAWVSTAAESLDPQKEALDRADVDRLFADVTSRAKLTQALPQLCKGDTLVVWKLDRLGLRPGDLIKMVEDFSRRGIGFRSLQEGIDTTTAGGKFMFHAVGAGAKLERHSKTDAARPNARLHSRRRGRRFKLDEHKQALAIALHQDPTNSVAAICRRFRIGRSTLYRYLAKESMARDYPRATDGSSTSWPPPLEIVPSPCERS